MKLFCRPLPLFAVGLVLALFCSWFATGCKPSGVHTSHASNIVTVTEANFQAAVLGANKPVLVDFWASWCPPCKALAPIIDEIATDYDGRVVVAKVDVDAAPALAQRFEIRAIPTVLMFRNGKVVDQFTGLRSKTEIGQQLDKLLAEATGTTTNAASADRRQLFNSLPAINR